MILALTMLKRISRIYLLAAVGGCTILPQIPPRPADHVPPTAWQGNNIPTTGGPVSTQIAPWWDRLEDRRLNALQRQALETNVDALRKALSWRSALAQAKLTELGEQPSPNLVVNTSTNRALESGRSAVLVNGISIPLETATTSRSYGISAGLSYEWDLWSKLAQTTKGDRLEAEIRHEDWVSARWLVSTNVAEAYWTIAAIDAKIPILTELSNAADEAVRIARLRLKEGRLRADEVDLTITKQYEIRKRLNDAHIDRGLRLNELAVLLDGEPPALPIGEARLPTSLPPEPVLDTPAQTLERRPDIRQARLAVDAALARLYVAEASRYPALSMSLNLGTNGTHWRDWVSQPLASLGLNLAIPLVDWRRLDVKRDIARNTLDDAALTLRTSVRQAISDVQNGLLERERWEKKWQAAEAQRVEKQNVYSVAILRQDVGVFGRLDVLHSQEGVLAAQIETIDLRLQAWLNLLKLYKALGGAV